MANGLFWVQKKVRHVQPWKTQGYYNIYSELLHVRQDFWWKWSPESISILWSCHCSFADRYNTGKNCVISITESFLLFGNNAYFYRGVICNVRHLELGTWKRCIFVVHFERFNFAPGCGLNLNLPEPIWHPDSKGTKLYKARCTNLISSNCRSQNFLNCDGCFDKCSYMWV